MATHSNRLVTLVLLGWLCLAVGVAGWFHNASAPAVAAIVWTLTALVLLACWKITPIRVWALNVDVRWLLLLHLTRLPAGVYFLLLCERDQLPCAFARPAGWGDMIVAFLALVVVGSDVDSICEGASAYLELDRTDRHYLCCVQRATIWIERPAINARAAGTSIQSSPYVSGAAYHRIARFDFRSTWARGTSSQ